MEAHNVQIKLKQLTEQEQVKHQEEKKAVAEVVASEEAEVVIVVVEAEAAPVADQAVLPKMTGFPRLSLDV